MPAQKSAMAPADRSDLADMLATSEWPTVAVAVRKAMVKSLEMMLSHCVIDQ
jgi:hypothetical protein